MRTFQRFGLITLLGGLLLIPLFGWPTNAGAAPMFGDNPCPPLEKPVIDTSTPATKPIGNASGAPILNATTGRSANTPQTIGSSPLFSSNGIFTFQAPPVMAQSKLGNRTQLITFVINTLLLIAVVVFILLIPIGGLQWLASAGNEESSTKARHLLVNAVVGLFLTLAAEGIGNIVLRQFGVNFSFNEVFTAISTGTISPAGTPGGGAATVPPGQRQVTFRLVALLASDGGPLANFGMTLIGPQGTTVGNPTSGADGSILTTVTIPIEATTISIYHNGDQQGVQGTRRDDTILGQFTIDAEYTSYGCVSATLNTNHALLPVTLQFQPSGAGFAPSPSEQMSVTISSGTPGEPEQTFSLPATGGTYTTNLHLGTSYQVHAIINGYWNGRGSFVSPGFDQLGESTPTVQVPLQ